ncbi:putative methyltransferase PMT26 [Wolffia australiana]
MALGRNSRSERRSSPSNCSTVTLVVFVGLCLVGIWMMTSSDVVPGDVSNSESQSDVKTKVETDTSFDESVEELAKDDIKVNSSAEDGSSQTSTEQEDSGDQVESPQDKSTDVSSPVQAYEDTDANDGQFSTDGDTNQDPHESGNEEQEEKPVEVGDEEKVKDAHEAETEQKKLDGSESWKKSGQEKGIDLKGKIETMNETVPSSTDNLVEKEPGKHNFSAAVSEETTVLTGAWSTQAAESKNEKKSLESLSRGKEEAFSWTLCNVSARTDYIPCLDNELAIKKLRSTKHYEHRERHCPEESPTCLVPLPVGYRQPIKWPLSRDKIWYFNVPHPKLAVVKGHQNWVKISGEYLTFPGGGTQFQHGALHYIDFIQEILPDIAWGKQSRVVLDVGCGVASFGGYLFERNVLTMSFAPKDEHEAQVQFALERGIPAILAVMGTKRLPFPGNIFDIVHCARCRVPWHIEGGKLLLELNRMLRPGGYFVWSATPVYQKLPEDVEIWEAMSQLTKSMCWDLLTSKKDSVNGVGVAIYRKPSSNECYETRETNEPPLCPDSDDRDAAWNISLQACMHRVPKNPTERGSEWPKTWPKRLQATPYWVNASQTGVYGKPAPDDYQADYEHWKHVVTSSYLNITGIDWSTVRNAMDMSSVYGGFAAALIDLNIWVMNVVPIHSPDTLAIIYERGLFGMYHDWCESFSTYPRSYDLLHADHLFSKLKHRCNLLPVVVEVDRILRPGGHLIMRDTTKAIEEVDTIGKSLHYETRILYLNEKGLLLMTKTGWRPEEPSVNAAASAQAVVNNQTIP